MIGTRETDLLNLLYRAVAAPDLWPSFLEGFADRLGAGSAWISHLHVSDGGGGGLVVRMGEGTQRSYFERFQAVDPLSRPSPPGLRHPGVLRDGDLVRHDGLRRSPFYNEFLVPNDVDAVLMVRTSEGDGKLRTLNVNRSARLDPFSGDDVEVAAFFRPHVATATDLAHRLALLRLSAPATRGSRQGSVVLGGVDRVTYVDPVAEADWFATGHLRVSGGRLASPHRSVEDCLGRLLAGARGAVGGVRQGGRATVALPGGVGMSLAATPLHAHETSPFSDDATMVVVFSGAGVPVVDRFYAVARAHCLTPAEREVARSLVDGASVSDIAASRRVSLNTVRTHVARLLGKTGCGRQVDLVRLVLTHGAPDTPDRGGPWAGRVD